MCRKTTEKVIHDGCPECEHSTLRAGANASATTVVEERGGLDFWDDYNIDNDILNGLNLSKARDRAKIMTRRDLPTGVYEAGAEARALLEREVDEMDATAVNLWRCTLCLSTCYPAKGWDKLRTVCKGSRGHFREAHWCRDDRCKRVCR